MLEQDRRDCRGRHGFQGVDDVAELTHTSSGQTRSDEIRAAAEYARIRLTLRPVYVRPNTNRSRWTYAHVQRLSPGDGCSHALRRLLSDPNQDPLFGRNA